MRRQYADNQLSRDDTRDWLARLFNRCVTDAQLQQQAADYYLTVYDALPPLIQDSLREMRQEFGEQDINKMTKFQIQQIVTRVIDRCTDRLSVAFQEKKAEAEGLQRMKDEGKPTGNNYWFEVPELMDPEVPGFLKEEIFEAIKKDRPANSEASQSTIADADWVYGQHPDKVPQAEIEKIRREVEEAMRAGRSNN